jgi:hypothetical protein
MAAARAGLADSRSGAAGARPPQEGDGVKKEGGLEIRQPPGGLEIRRPPAAAAAVEEVGPLRYTARPVIGTQCQPSLIQLHGIL